MGKTPSSKESEDILPSRGKTCAVIGSGIAGIASAIRISRKGYAVDVFEANDYPGGKFREWRDGGYRFDLGPTVFTLPGLVDELFEICGEDPRDYFSYSKLEIPFRYFFEDGQTITAYADTDRYAKEIAANTADDEQSFYNYLYDISQKFEITREVFIENSLHIPGNYLTRKSISGMFRFGRIDAFKSMDSGNKKFFNDPRLVQILNKCAKYVGSNPYVAPATLNVIQHLEMNTGLFLPERGMYEIIRALVQLAKKMGVQFHFNTYVQQVLTSRKQAYGILTETGKELPYDRVISNMDIYHTYHKLLPDARRPKKILSQPKSSSLVCFYWGIKQSFPQLAVHNMLFTQDPKKEYDTIFGQQNIVDDPSVYLGITSKHVAGDAPEGCENWYVLVNSPNLQGQDWNEIVSRTRKNVINKINRMLDTDLETLIETEYVLTPEIIAEQYRSEKGAVYGNSSNSKFSAFLRHANFSRRIANLYFVGGSVHPGPGIPMCLNSARIMEKVFR